MSDCERELENVQDQIDMAQQKVAKERIAYGKGTGSVSAVNRAERGLADLQQRKWRISAGLVSDLR